MTAAHWDNEKRADLETQPDSSCPHCTQVTTHGASLCEACGGTITLTTIGTSTLETHHTLWAVLSGRGDSLSAQPHLVKGLALTGEASPAGSVALPSHDVGVCCRNHLAVTRWELGRADNAAQHARRALELAVRIDRPLTYATALYVSAWIHYHRGDHDVVERLARTLTAHALEFGLDRSWEIDGRLLLLSGRRQHGRHSDEELAALEPDIVSEPSGRSAWRDAFMRCLLARAHLRAGRPGRALETLSRLPSRITNGNYAPEVHRLSGEALVAVGAPSEHAEISFRNAIWLARPRQVVAFELRARMSLALLLARRGEGDAASAMLRRIYAHFTEGFETTDLRRAQQLLESLRQTA